jgi:UDP-2,4-diacetamido-2,4,6-trideoxy-beta-L-altropyranose hydrolase
VRIRCIRLVVPGRGFRGSDQALSWLRQRRQLSKLTGFHSAIVVSGLASVGSMECRRHLAFRTEAGKGQGTGHLMRTLALAEELRDAASIQFIVSHASAGQDLILERGFALTRISGGDGMAQGTVDALRGAGSSTLITDLDGLSAGYVEEIRTRLPSLRVVCLDDRSIPPKTADLLIRPHAVDEWWPASQPGVLLGPRYWVLRKEFDAVLSRESAAAPVPEVARRVVILLGGSPPEALLVPLVRRVNECCPELDVHVVLGPLAADLQQICDALGRLGPRVRFHFAPAKLAAMMSEADLCVASASYTAYELAALGKPMVVLALVDHQVHTARAFARRRAGVAVLSNASEAAEETASHVARLVHDRAARTALSLAARELVDGLGRRRLANLLLDLASTYPTLLDEPCTGP